MLPRNALALARYAACVIVLGTMISGCAPVLAPAAEGQGIPTVVPPIATATLPPSPTVPRIASLDPDRPLFGGCQTVAPGAGEENADDLVNQAVITPTIAGVLHWVNESYQVYGIPIGGGSYQPVTRTSEVWLDSENPLRRARWITETVGQVPPRLTLASVSDGETWFYYRLEKSPTLVFAAPARYLASGPDVQTEVQGRANLLAERLAWGRAGQGNWCYLGYQTLPAWGETQVVAFDWYCRDHGGCPADEWYSELWWLQLPTGRLPQYAVVRHSGEGQSELIRLDRLLKWEMIPVEQVPAEAFAFTAPPDTRVVVRETLVDPTDPSVGPEGVLTLQEFAQVAEFTPVLPTQSPAGYHLSYIEADPEYLLYRLVY